MKTKSLLVEIVAVAFACAFLPAPPALADVRVLTSDRQKAIVGGNDCSNGGNGGHNDDQKGTGVDPIDFHNGNIFYTFTDFSYPTRGGGEIRLSRTYNAQIFSDLPHWEAEKRSGTWVLQNGVYNGQGDRSLSNLTYTDAIIDADILTVDPGSNDWETAHINFRFTDENNRYYVIVSQSGVVELSKKVDGVYTNLAASQGTEFDPAIWNHIRIENIGANIKVFINGAPVCEANDGSLSSGKVALNAHFSHCHFDNVATVDPNNPSYSISNGFEDNDNDGPFGNQWTFTYGERLWERSNGDVVVERATGHRDMYAKNGSIYTSPRQAYDTLVKNGGGDFILTDKHGVVRAFASDGTLSSIRDRNNNTTTLGYTTINATVGPLERADRALLVDAFESTLYYNAVGRWTSDNGTLSSLQQVDVGTPETPNKALEMTWSALGAYWYSILDNYAYVQADLSAYSHLSVELRGASGGERFGIELQTPQGTYTLPVANYATLTTGWQTVQIPLAHFETLGADLTQVRAVSIVFNSAAAGTVQMDNLWFVKIQPPAQPVTYSVKRLTSITDPSGRVTSLTYGVNGKVSQMTDPAGRTYLFQYDADGNLTSSSDGRHHVRNFEYNPNRTLKKYTDRNGNAYQFAYAYNNRCLQQTDPNGKVTTYTYLWNFTEIRNSNNDLWSYQFDWNTGNLVAVTNPLGHYESWTLDPNTGEFYQHYDRNQHLTSRTLDAKGNILTITDALNHTTTFTYDPTFNLVTGVTNARGKTTTLAYDSQGNLTSITDANGKVSSFTYDTHGNRLSATDPLGHAASFTYDTHGHLTAREDALGNRTEFTSNALGEVLTVKDPRLKTSSFGRDNDGQIITAVNPLNQMTVFEYDGNGNRTAVTQPGALRTEYFYDAVNNLVRIVDPLNNATEFVYDSKNFMTFGQRLATSARDANAHTTVLAYDALGRLVSETDAKGAVTQYTYDAEGLLLSLKDARLNVTSFEYDAANRLTKRTFPDSSFEGMAYDEVGNLTSYSSRIGDSFGLTYDNLNRRHEKYYPGGQKIVYTYDDAGRMTRVDDLGGAITTHAYDDANRLTSMTDRFAKTVSYQYDAASNRTRLTYPDATYLTYTYDDGNRLTSIHDADRNEDYTFSYDTVDRRTQLLYPNGVKAEYVYDQAHRLTSLVNKDPANQVLSQFNYALDPAGNRTSRVTTAGTDAYTYDNIDQVTLASYTGGSRVVSYNYDPAGNRTSTVDNGVTTTYTSNFLNQYLVVNGQSHVYNANGSLIADGTRTLTYDFDNRLTQVVNGGNTVGNSYDFAGRRIGHTTGGITRNFVYDGIHVIADLTSGGAIARKYILGPGIDEVLAIKTENSVSYLTRDGLNSVSEATDASGAKTESYTYDIFGLPAFFDGNGTPITASAIGNRYLFTGREWEQASGLYYYRARHYDPALGRFVQPDPIGLSGGLNLYSYCRNNPAAWFDPFGLDLKPITRTGTLKIDDDGSGECHNDPFHQNETSGTRDKDGNIVPRGDKDPSLNADEDSFVVVPFLALHLEQLGELILSRQP